MIESDDEGGPQLMLLDNVILKVNVWSASKKTTLPPPFEPVESVYAFIYEKIVFVTVS